MATIRLPDSQRPPPPACPAPDAATKTAGRLPVRSRAPPFGCAGSLLAGPSASGSGRSSPVATTFRSPATTACLQATIAGSKLPACRFPAPPALPRKPLTGRSPAPGGLHPRRVGIMTTDPHSRLRRALPAAPRFSTPRRGLSSAPDRSVRPDLLPESSPSGTARLSFAPRSRSME